MKEKTIDYVLRATWQAVSRLYNEEAVKYGATMAQCFALLSIDRDKGINSTALGPKMGMKTTSLSRTLKSMEQQGLIKKSKNKADNRSITVSLTEKGLEKRELTKDKVLQFNEVVKQNITEEQWQNFMEVTEIIKILINENKIFNKEE